MNKLFVVFMVMVGVINFLPVLGVLSAARIADAYDVVVTGNDMEILLRHRALLFGIVGGFIFYSLYNPAMQGAAMTLAGISMIGFLLLVIMVGGHNAAINRIMLADVVGIACLAGAIVIKYFVAAGGAE
ncbi:MAG: phosphopantetheine adenylyltransferase [Halioglobus sp.]|nr:phosphopantetheine adenylyltransferase [Halioglobus sp.]